MLIVAPIARSTVPLMMARLRKPQHGRYRAITMKKKSLSSLTWTGSILLAWLV